MLGGKNKQPLGYTIIEVMIVLAVSGVMFIIAANFIGDKQAKTAFAEGVNETASRLQGVIEQVRNGQYSDINVNCTFNSTASPADKVNFPVGAKTQGTNFPCVFLGKLVYFSYDADVPDSSGYEVFSLAGGRLAGDQHQPITTPQDAGAKIINNNSGVNLTTKETAAQNLNIYKMTVTDSATPPSTHNSYGIAFLQSPSVDAGNDLTNGAATVNLYYVDGLQPNDSAPEDRINGGTNLVTAKSAEICLTDGTRYAKITMGATGGSLSVGVKMNGTTPC